MPQVDVNLDLFPSCVRCGEDVFGVKDEHPLFFMFMQQFLVRLFGRLTPDFW
jgi:hypothetical protein